MGRIRITIRNRGRRKVMTRFRAHGLRRRKKWALVVTTLRSASVIVGVLVTRSHATAGSEVVDSRTWFVASTGQELLRPEPSFAVSSSTV
jgi:hypothetical protein